MSIPHSRLFSIFFSLEMNLKYPYNVIYYSTESLLKVYCPIVFFCLKQKLDGDGKHRLSIVVCRAQFSFPGVIGTLSPSL